MHPAAKLVLSLLCLATLGTVLAQRDNTIWQLERLVAGVSPTYQFNTTTLQGEILAFEGNTFLTPMSSMAFIRRAQPNLGMQVGHAIFAGLVEYEPQSTQAPGFTAVRAGRTR